MTRRIYLREKKILFMKKNIFLHEKNLEKTVEGGGK